ncbi:MAG: metal-sensitive transcriptional regulator, partial [Bellilinea sp.]
GRLTMKVRSEETRTSMINRLRRVQGQLGGIETMLNEDRECRDVLQQLSAVRSAVHSAMLAYMEAYISECVLEQMETSSDRSHREKLASELIHMLEKTT